MWLYKASVSVIILPLDSFREVADVLGPPRGKLILASHPGRVGSTVFCNLVHHLSSEIFSFSSHHSFYVLHRLKRELSPKDYEKILPAVVRLAFKPLKVSV